MTVTTEEAAELAGVQPATIRSWVMKGWLVPLPRLDPTRRHHLFVVESVVRCEFEHRTKARRANYRRAQAEYARLLADA